MKLLRFLNEGRTRGITEDAFLSELPKYRDAVLSPSPLYRHISDTFITFGIVNPSQFVRESAYTSNYYTMLIDEILPSWKGWPKRSRSIVCTTSFETALDRSENNEDVYLVLPCNGSILGVCPADDIWYSFKKLFNRMGINDMNEFNNIIDSYLGRSVIRNASELEEFLTVISQYEEFPSLKGLDNLMNPNTNGFKKVRVGSEIPYNREVWTSGESLLISVSYIPPNSKKYHIDINEIHDWLINNID